MLQDFGVTPFGYAGGYTDPTGLIYLINRYYDPPTAQFLSVDPLVSITDQPYVYVGGDPVNWVDPLGLYWQPVCGGGTMAQGEYGPPVACTSSSIQTTCTTSSCEATIMGSPNAISYSDKGLVGDFHISAPGQSSCMINTSNLPSNVSNLNVWDWIPADMVSLPLPSQGTGHRGPDLLSCKAPITRSTGRVSRPLLSLPR
ncbi:MAG: RHS repeat-associated core domain-containing protein [Acidimicrobiales bacterium]